MFNHGDFEIEVGLAHEHIDGRFTVAWAVYRRPRIEGPVYAGTTIAFNDPETAVAMAMAQARLAANESD
jgi:hypothetical protein